MTVVGLIWHPFLGTQVLIHTRDLDISQNSFIPTLTNPSACESDHTILTSWKPLTVTSSSNHASSMALNPFWLILFTLVQNPLKLTSISVPLLFLNLPRSLEFPNQPRFPFLNLSDAKSWTRETVSTHFSSAVSAFLSALQYYSTKVTPLLGVASGSPLLPSMLLEHYQCLPFS